MEGESGGSVMMIDLGMTMMILCVSDDNTGIHYDEHDYHYHHHHHNGVNVTAFILLAW